MERREEEGSNDEERQNGQGREDEGTGEKKREMRKRWRKRKS